MTEGSDQKWGVSNRIGEDRTARLEAWRQESCYQELRSRVKRTQTTSLNSENVKLPLKMAPDEIIFSEDKPVNAAGEENFNEDLRRSVIGES